MNSPQSNSSHGAPLSLLRRIPLAFGALFSLMANGALAARYAALREGGVASSVPAPAPAPVVAPAPAPVPPPSPVLKDTGPEAALQLLALLQRDARLIDFVGEDLAGYADAQIGAAARLVHEGCAKVLREHFTLVPVRDETEGARVVLQPGFDASAVRVTGNVVGQPPFSGQLAHRGWRVTDVRLPRLAAQHDARVVAPAEVEL